jgi:hypothetical protein
MRSNVFVLQRIFKALQSMHCYMGGLVVVMVMCRHTWRQLILRKFDRLNMSMDDGEVTWGLTSNTKKLTKICV